jgi:hypothetical protein
MRKSVATAVIHVLQRFCIPGIVLLIAMVMGLFVHAVADFQNRFALEKCSKLLTEKKINITCHTQSISLYVPSTTPWNCIGGCGASGSGSVGDGIQWLGNGVSGGLVDIEVLSRYTLRKNFKQLSMTPRFSCKPTWTTSAGISAPIMSKSGSVQYQANQQDEDRTTGGLGDLTVDFSKSLGYSGTYQLQLSMTLPTGQYDIKRGIESNPKFLPVDFQMGSGIYSATLQLSHTIDVEGGFLKFDASYSHPFNLRPFLKENEMLDDYYSAYRDRKDNERFYYQAKPYGESDLGAYIPPSISIAGYYAYRGETGYVHSCGLFLSAPLGIAWIPEPVINKYAPIKDPGHKAWSSAFIYELEFSRSKYPILLAVSIPFHDKPDDRGHFNGPEWGDFLQQWIFAMGIKSTMF